jgi:hypothetical protein
VQHRGGRGNKKMKKSLFACVILLCLGVALAEDTKPPAGKKVLVIADDLEIKTSHSKYFKFLKGEYSFICAKA